MFASVTGHSYAPDGEVVGLDEFTEDDHALVDVARVCSLCNDAAVEYQDGEYVVMVDECGSGLEACCSHHQRLWRHACAGSSAAVSRPKRRSRCWSRSWVSRASPAPTAARSDATTRATTGRRCTRAWRASSSHAAASPCLCCASRLLEAAARGTPATTCCESPQHWHNLACAAWF